MDWITDKNALLTIRTLGLREGDEVRLDFPGMPGWSGVELRITSCNQEMWEVETIKPSNKGLSAGGWDPKEPPNWKLTAWRRQQ